MTRFSYIPPTDAIWKGLRKHDVTSTESPALFDLSPYMSKFELFHRKKNKDITDIKMNNRMLWGKRMEATIAQGIGEDNGVIVRPMPQYKRIVRSRMGASFDFEIIGLCQTLQQQELVKAANVHRTDAWPPESYTVLQRMFLDHGPGIFEIKAVDYIAYRDDWTKNDDKSIEAPGHIEIQLQHQLHVDDEHKWGAIGVLVAGNSPKVITRMRDVEVGAALEAATVQLWEDIRSGKEPDPWYPDDADFVKKLNCKILDGVVYDGRVDEELTRLCEDYLLGITVENGGKEMKESAMSHIYQKIGTATRALSPDFNISSWVVGDVPIHAYVRKGFRSMKITRKKAS